MPNYILCYMLVSSMHEPSRTHFRMVEMTSRIIISSGETVVNNVNRRCKCICIASLFLCFIGVLLLLFGTQRHSIGSAIEAAEDMIHMRGSSTHEAAAGEVAYALFGVVFTNKITNIAALFGVGPQRARKLLQSSDEGGDGNNGSDEGRDGGDGSSYGGGGDGSSDEGDMNGTGTQCSKNDISIYQGETAPLPSGIPAFSVEIVNMCTSSSCSISDIHINCGWFSTSRLVNPRVFRRMDYNDCLVNDGEPLGPGQSLSFQYANAFRYPLSVSSVAC